MDSDKKPKKKNLMDDKVIADEKDKSYLLDSKTLHDLYRHTTKLIE